MWKSTEGSTGRLGQLCAAYFVFYVITGVTVKYFLGSASAGFPGMSELVFLVYSTVGGSAVCLAVVFARRWYRLDSARRIRWGGVEFPAELLYIVPSGICTAVVIPTTTLMYTLPVSVMVAMVIMRASVIVIGRVVDALQIRQGILTKRVYPEENAAVAVAVAAAGIHIFGKTAGGFEFLKSAAAVAILGSYICAYSIRIYIMNYYKNTRPRRDKLDNRPFFGIEQMAASVTMAAMGLLVFHSPSLFGWGGVAQVELFRSALIAPHPMWGAAVLAGVGYGMVAFFSVFIFMFKGRTATFAGLVNRLTSLVAGTAATLACWRFFGMKFPSRNDWVSLAFVLLAVAFLTAAEKKRAKELLASHEISDGGGRDGRRHSEHAAAAGPSGVGEVGDKKIPPARAA